MVESSKGLKPWRKAVADAALSVFGDACWLDGPLTLGVCFFFPRPKGHFGTGRNAERLKPSAPIFHTVTPDTDKLLRAIGDALTGIVYRDDSQLAQVVGFKFYGPEPGAVIVVDQLEGEK